jgi:hypothetical protein
MSEAYDKGRDYERLIAKLISKKLNIRLSRDTKSGAGDTNKADLNNYRSVLPIPFSIEAKNQITTKPKEWYRQSKNAAATLEIPLVIFKDELNNLCLIELDDLLNIVKEVADLRAEIDALRKPLTVIDEAELIDITLMRDGSTQLGLGGIKRSHHECRNGHLSDDYGYCQILTCKYSRSYRPPKKGKK